MSRVGLGWVGADPVDRTGRIHQVGSSERRQVRKNLLKLSNQMN